MVEVHLVLNVLLMDLFCELLVQVVQLTAVLAEATDQVAHLGGAVGNDASLVDLGANGGVTLNDHRVVDSSFVHVF